MRRRRLVIGKRWFPAPRAGLEPAGSLATQQLHDDREDAPANEDLRRNERRNGVEWSGVEWSGVEWNRVEWSGVEWSGVEWSQAEPIQVKFRAAKDGYHVQPRAVTLSSRPLCD